MAIAPPEPLAASHDVSVFHCGHPELAGWLRRRARDNEDAQGSRCFVVCEARRVIGFYALAAGSIGRAQALGSVRRNMPEPIPAIMLGRLAVDSNWQGRGLGADLLQDAVLRALRASREIGARVLLCHAIDAKAKAFYLWHGFAESTFDPLTVVLDLKKVKP
ncbi:MAG: GNAT family N-acetyltransferase [Rhodanobacteraceae bacterium]